MSEREINKDFRADKKIQKISCRHGPQHEFQQRHCMCRIFKTAKRSKLDATALISPCSKCVLNTSHPETRDHGRLVLQKQQQAPPPQSLLNPDSTRMHGKPRRRSLGLYRTITRSSILESMLQPPHGSTRSESVTSQRPVPKLRQRHTPHGCKPTTLTWDTVIFHLYIHPPQSLTATHLSPLTQYRKTPTQV